MAELLTDADWEEDKRRFHLWLLENVGIEPAMLKSLQETDDDWTFIIKIHALLEVALNHMIVGRVGHPQLNEMIEHLSIQGGRASKLGFVRAFNLLPANGIKFIGLISSVRRKLVHDIKNFDFDLRQYLSELDKSQLDNWKIGLIFCLGEPVPQHLFDFSVTLPRFSIFEACMSVMSHSFQAQPGRMVDLSFKALRRAFEQQQESSPKE